MAGSGAQIILQGQRPDVQVMSPYEISKQNLSLRQQQQSVAENDLTLEKIKAQIAQSKQDAQEDFAAQQIVNDPNLDTPTKLQKLGGVSNRIANTVGARLLKEAQAGQAEDIQRAQLAQGQTAPEVKTPGPVIQGAQLPGYDPEQNGNGAVASAAPIQEAPTTQAVAIPPQDMEIRGALGKSFKVPVVSHQQQITEAGRVSSLEQAKLDMNARRTAAAEAAKIEATQKANQTTVTDSKGKKFTGRSDIADNWLNAQEAGYRAEEQQAAHDNSESRHMEFEAGQKELDRKNAITVAGMRGSNGTGATSNDPKDIAQAIIDGKQQPLLTGLYRDAAPVRAELARKGYDLASATSDWNAVQKHLATMNGAQQEKLRQAINFTQETIPQIEAAYAEWKKQAGVSGLKILNKANLATMKQLPGAPGSAATNLDALIADFTSELGTVYKGGNSSTDESLKLAAKNLESNWNEQTFNDAIKRLKASVQIRANSINSSQPAGVSSGNTYTPDTEGGTPPVQSAPKIIRYDSKGNRIQ